MLHLSSRLSGWGTWAEALLRQLGNGLAAALAARLLSGSGGEAGVCFSASPSLPHGGHGAGEAHGCAASRLRAGGGAGPWHGLAAAALNWWSCWAALGGGEARDFLAPAQSAAGEERRRGRAGGERGAGPGARVLRRKPGRFSALSGGATRRVLAGLCRERGRGPCGAQRSRGLGWREGGSPGASPPRAPPLPEPPRTCPGPCARGRRGRGHAAPCSEQLPSSAIRPALRGEFEPLPGPSRSHPKLPFFKSSPDA